MPRLNQINMEKLAKTLLIIFTCSTIISALSVYYTHQLPISENQTTTLCTYQHTGTYNYVAELKPNIIYGNKTTLTPGEGTLYTAIVNQINLTFTYEFKCTPTPTNKTTLHEIVIQVESPEKWPPRTLSNIEAKEMLQLNGNLNLTMEINGTKIKELVDSVDKETGTYSTTYNINIKPKIYTVANVTTQTIDETFIPELTVTFHTGTEKGSYIAIENLQQTKPGKLTETQQIPMPWIQNQRALAYLATATATAALAISAFVYNEYKPAPPPTKIIEKLTAPYKELVAKTTQKPPETKTIIEMETLEDLAKTAEILARPILHATDGKEHTFYIIDNNTKYQHKTKT